MYLQILFLILLVLVLDHVLIVLLASVPFADCVLNLRRCQVYLIFVASGVQCTLTTKHYNVPLADCVLNPQISPVCPLRTVYSTYSVFSVLFLDNGVLKPGALQFTLCGLCTQPTVFTRVLFRVNGALNQQSSQVYPLRTVYLIYSVYQCTLCC